MNIFLNLIKKINKKLKIFFLFFITTFTLFPNFTNAEVYFSEINYDPEGTDAGYEWVEVYNNNLSEINFSEYKFCEGGTCHSLKKNGDDNDKIPKNSFAIITSDPEKFLEKNNNFSEDSIFLFKASFSLRNSGIEKLELKNKEKNIVSILEYNSDIGGKNGDTLSVVDNILVNSESTAGKKNIKKDIIPDENNDNKNDNEEKGESDKKELPKIQRSYVEFQDENSDLIDGQKKVKVIIEPMNILLAGGSHIFSAKVLELSGSNISRPSQIKYFWNFGDGQISNEKNPNHIYETSGEFVISLKVLINSFSGKTKVKVRVVETPIFIEKVDYEKKEIILKNNSDYVIDISGFKIVSQNNFFIIPAETFINAKEKITFSNKIMGLKFENNFPLALTYKNNKTVNIFKENLDNKIKEEIKNKIYNIEQEILKKENKIKKIDNNSDFDNFEKYKKDSQKWNVSIDEIRNLEKLKWQVEKEKVLVELYNLKAKRRKIKISLEKAEASYRKSSEDNNKKNSEGEEKEKKDIKEGIEKNKITDSEKVFDLQNLDKEIGGDNKKIIIKENDDFLNNIKKSFLGNIFYLILLGLIGIFSTVIYFYKKDGLVEKNSNEEGVEGENFDEWDVEEIREK